MKQTTDESITLLTEAFHARRRNDYEVAIQLFLQEYERDHTNLYALVEIARVEAMRMEYRAMRQYLAKAEILAGEDEEARLEIAKCWLETLTPEECVRVCRGVADAPPSNPILFATLLEAMERMNQVEEGISLIHSRDDLPLACKVIAARLSRRHGNLDQAMTWLSGETSAKGLMERARILDAMGRTRNAVESLERAKRIIAANPATDYERHLIPVRAAHLCEVREKVSTQWVTECNAKDLGMARPLVFLIGHPRSGTTLLETLLEKTGRMVIASEYAVLEQEMSKFVQQKNDSPTASDLSQKVFPMLHASSADIRVIRENYWQKITSLSNAKEGEWIVDKNPGLTDGVHWIARFWPESKILCILRDPRDVIVSCVYQDFGPSRLGVSCLTWEGAARAWAETMHHWVAIRDLLPVDRWMELRYEDLVIRADSMLNEISHFIGLPQASTAPVPAPSRLIRTPSYADVAAPVYQRAVGRWKAYDRWLRPLRPIIEPTMEKLGYHWD